MITEDYCSFEISKLLKEKGFEGDINAYYHIWDNGNKVCSVQEFSHSEAPHLYIPAPTHQMAMKWLREVHLLFIDIDPLTCYKWSWSIWFMNDPKQKVGESPQTISTYEKACEAAIKYCLELLYDYRRLC